MSLPQISQPHTNVVLPTGRKIKIRPFIGAEEKALLMAKQSNVQEDKITAAIDVLSSCSGIDASELCMTDFEFLFMKEYEISVSQKIDAKLRCKNTECEELMQVAIPLDKIEVPEIDTSDKTIEVGKDDTGKQVRLFLKIPTVGDSIKFTGDKDGDVKLIFESLKGIYADEDECEIESYEEFSKWMMSQTNVYRECASFINSVPRISFERTWKCPSCEHENNTVIKGFESFFS